MRQSSPTSARELQKVVARPPVRVKRHNRHGGTEEEEEDLVHFSVFLRYALWVRSPGAFLANLARKAAAQLLRIVPGSAALRLRRDLRDESMLEDADAIVVSFPKSGRTFVRAMLSRLFQRRFGIDERELLEFGMLKRAPPGVPRIMFTHAGDAMRGPGEIQLDPSQFARAKVVLIARHPGDIAVSRYFHLKHRSRDRARRRLASQPLETFVWAEEGGVPSIVAFLNQFASLPGISILRYEDFLSDRTTSLRRLASALGLDVDEEDIADAAEFGSVQNLKTLESEGYFTSPRLRRARKGDAQSGKVRTGRSGGYREQLGAKDADEVDAYIAKHLDPGLGYLRSGQS